MHYDSTFPFGSNNMPNDASRCLTNATSNPRILTELVTKCLVCLRGSTHLRTETWSQNIKI